MPFRKDKYGRIRLFLDFTSSKTQQERLKDLKCYLKWMLVAVVLFVLALVALVNLP